MVFSSIIFCTIFLPLCLAAYYGLPRLFMSEQKSKLQSQNVILLCFSLLFYMFGGIKYIFLIAAIICINWGGGFLCCPFRHIDHNRKIALVGIISADLLILFFFKYFNLFIACIENIFFPENSGFVAVMDGILMGQGNGALGISEIVLPVGISFFTFQAMSYVIDVYTGVAEIQGNIINFALYIACFPQLIAGPIVHYKDVAEQITDRAYSGTQFADGIHRFCYGLAKKVLIANTLGAVVDSIWSTDISSIDATVAWVGSLFYTFQIYYDFSGYSDMAIGLGKMFGFEFKENFNYPYQATSVRDFWRRWHISLSSWFRDYVYIPLGGSRVTKKKTCINIFIVFLLTGIWHGANWTFLMWGVIYGVLLIIERLFLGTVLQKNKCVFLNRFITFIIVNFLWVVFRADSLKHAFIYLGKMFRGGLHIEILLTYLSGTAIIAFVFAIIFNGFIQRFVKIKNVYAVSVLSIVLLMISLLFMINGTYNPFIYYQF